MSTSNHVFSAFSFISFVLVSIPLPWHLEARNSATCLYILWVSLSNLAFFINSILWDGNVVNRSPVWCDICSRLFLACYVAVPATCLCVHIRIHGILSHPFATNTTAYNRCMLILDLLIGLGFPLLSLLFDYFVQPYRYVILEDVGCLIEFEKNAVSMAVIFVSRLGPGVVGNFYGYRNMYHIWKKRRELKSILGSSANFNHYIKLFILSGIDIVITTPYYLWYFTTWQNPIPWPGWNMVHNWSQIPLIPASEWQRTALSAMTSQMPRWMNVVYGLIFFIILGIGPEVRASCASAWKYVSEIFCWRSALSRKSASPHISFAENQPSTSDKSDFLVSLNGTSRVISLTRSPSCPTPEPESEFSPPEGDLSKPSLISHQHHTTPIERPASPDGIKIQPPGLNNSEGV